MSLVARKTLNNGDNLKTAVSYLLLELGGLNKFVLPGERVLLKPNFNTADPPPASSDLEFVRAVTELVLAAGAKEVVIGDSSTFYQNTRKNLEKAGVFDLEKTDKRVKVVSFDEGNWIKKEIKNGKFLKSVSVPEILGKVDKMIFLPCAKTHFIAKFTGALKLGVGLMKRTERIALHTRHTEEKIAEMNLVFKPDLIIMDARKCFITKGPSNGEIREPNIVLASVSRVEIDLEEIKIIQSFPGNDLAGLVPEDLPQIKRAREVGIN